MSDINNQDYNPLLEINTSFESYLKARTRTYTDHVVGGRMDYAFDGDFAMRSKLNTMNGWNKLYKSITLTEIPNHYKKLFRTADIATSMLFANAYNAANKCSERMHLVPPQVMVKKAKGVPEIYSFSCDGVETSIVISSDIAEMCTEKELCYLIGCELDAFRTSIRSIILRSPLSDLPIMMKMKTQRIPKTAPVSWAIR